MLSSTDIEKKVAVYHTIEDIVKVMKAYAGVAIRKTEEIIQNVRVYEDRVFFAMADMIKYYPGIIVEEEQKGKRILVAFGSSQGLCGMFNEKMVESISDTFTDNDTLFIIGRRLKSALELRKIPYAVFNDSVASISGIPSALAGIVSEIMDTYNKVEYYNLSLLFTTIVDKKANIILEQVLPPDVKKLQTLTPSGMSPVLHLEPNTILEKLIEEFLFIALYRCYVESLRSENWYRLRSMEGASETLKKKLSALASTEKYIRQEEITEEMLEILGSGLFYKK
ncbi:MAG: F0F1 ATP synthase subunit gamma [Candidatus Brocadiaceae bacterium]|nr:F0F1 ATP synthase subunit gamma [Candidatus Brocadiaceae bacterium]